MQLEISSQLLNVIVGALRDLPFRIAAPALEELQQAINKAQGKGGIQVPQRPQRNGGKPVERSEFDAG